MSIHTLEVIEEDQIFFLADNSGEKIKCIDSDEYISHSNARFIDFIIEDLDRSGEFSVVDQRLDNIYFSAYHIFSQKKTYIENDKDFADNNWAYQEGRKYKGLADIERLILDDRVFIQWGNGPPLELDEIARLQAVRKELMHLYGEDEIKELINYAWGNKSLNNSRTSSFMEDDEYFRAAEVKNLSDWEGPGKLITDTDFRELPVVKKIKADILSCSNDELACITALSSMHNWESILIPFCLIRKSITKTKYSKAVMCFYPEALEGYLEDTSKEDHFRIYNLLESEASICLEYLEMIEEEDAKYLKELTSSSETGDKEYKAQVRYDRPFKEPDRRHYFDVIKSICGFINAEGGTVLVGYHEKDLQFVGIKVTDKENRGTKGPDTDKMSDDEFIDWWELYIREQLERRTEGHIAGEMIKFEFPKINDLICAVITVEPVSKKDRVWCRNIKGKYSEEQGKYILPMVLFQRQGNKTNKIDERYQDK